MNEVLGHKVQLAYLEGSVKAGDLHHSYLFFGKPNIGKSMVGFWFARLLLCEQTVTSDKRHETRKGYETGPCGKCHSCEAFGLGQNPDFIHIKDNGEVISIEEIREVREALSLSPRFGGYKVCLIENFNRATREAQNAFLKTLEEPEVKTVIVLTVSDKALVSDTISSRCRLLGFGVAANAQVEVYLAENGASKETAREIAYFSCGRVGLALKLLEQKESLEEKIALVGEITGSLSLQKRFFAASKISAGEDVEEFLDIWLLELRQDFKKNKKIIQKILAVKENLRTNANKKLMLENLLLSV